MPRWNGAAVLRRRVEPAYVPVPGKPPLVVVGMYGIGDSIYQRAWLRELMPTNDIFLHAYYGAMYHDLVEQGLKIIRPPHHRPRIRECTPPPIALQSPRMAPSRRISYSKPEIGRTGSILAAQYARCGLKMPARPDFSLPVLPEWRGKARRLIQSWDLGDKPILIYRPIVLNKVWECPARSPDPDVYAALFNSIRKKFFVVAVADLTQKEWIVGGEEASDVSLIRGELDFETMAGLFAEASLVFANPGMVPVLAQAVGAPVIIVYGGNESHRTTNSVGDHLAPTLAIEPDHPCECHSGKQPHDCDKHITIEPALIKIMEFAERHAVKAPRTLIFATTFVDTPERKNLVDQWIALHSKLNPDCDLLLVDSCSPLFWDEEGASKPGALPSLPRLRVVSFRDNIGHLALGGRDGWGRAFCKGLQAAIDCKYDYVAHIEGDSLFRLPVGPIVQEMQREKIDVASVPVDGTKKQEIGWVETGLMFFRVGYLVERNLIAAYEWPGRKPYPNTPERVLGTLVQDELKLMPWRAERGDKGQVSVDNVGELDWVTHCKPEVYERFMTGVGGEQVALSPPVVPLVKLNFGCGTNRLEGWQNFDAEINIAKRLPFPDGSADYIFAEHCVEHIGYYEALAFFRECWRVLRPGGVVRIAVPSVERVRKFGDPDYFRFASKWAPSADVRGAMHAILHSHGHKAPWNAQLLEDSLFYIGFDQVATCEPSKSAHAELVGAEGHGRVIGERMNWIETTVCEAMK